MIVVRKKDFELYIWERMVTEKKTTEKTKKKEKKKAPKKLQKR